jgi:raffinose/stachyose/melibiose transport system substrate-binding protein
MFRCNSRAINRWALLVGLAILALSSAGGPVVHAQSTVNLVLESWRSEDTSIWEDNIIPAYQATHPGVNITFRPTPNQYYAAALGTELQAGTAGDMFACPPFDTSEAFYNQGYLPNINDMPELSHFSTLARSGWTTRDGATTYCMPVASVMEGFTYNKDAFDKLGLRPPSTRAEFFQVLDAIKQDGTYIPLAMGTADGWTNGVMGLYSNGPNFWKGEDGRQALIAGTARLTDRPFVDAMTFLAQWGPYLPPGAQAVKYSDTQEMFPLGKAAIMPAGSWEITLFRQKANFQMGVFKPPVANVGDQGYIDQTIDIGFTYNPKSPNSDAAKDFVHWLGTSEFATLYCNALPGFFTLGDYQVQVADPLAQEYLSWLNDARPTIRLGVQYLSTGTPSLDSELFTLMPQVLNGTLSPDDAATTAQQDLDSWYRPPQR